MQNPLKKIENTSCKMEATLSVFVSFFTTKCPFRGSSCRALFNINRNKTLQKSLPTPLWEASRQHWLPEVLPITFWHHFGITFLFVAFVFRKKVEQSLQIRMKSFRNTLNNDNNPPAQVPWARRFAAGSLRQSAQVNMAYTVRIRTPCKRTLKALLKRAYNVIQDSTNINYKITKIHVKNKCSRGFS